MTKSAALREVDDVFEELDIGTATDEIAARMTCSGGAPPS